VDNICSDCRFWKVMFGGNTPKHLEEKYGPLDDMGECRRRSPLPLTVGWDKAPGWQMAHWPITSCDGWCGEFEAPK
jgi:hypothetical protein